MTEPMRCSHCGAPFTAVGSRRSARFCSRRCMGLSRRTSGLTARFTTRKGYIAGKAWIGDRKVSVLEHRWVLEQQLGRRLLPAERVHHINFNRADNRIENLKLYASQRDHWLAEHAHLPRRRRVAA